MRGRLVLVAALCAALLTALLASACASKHDDAAPAEVLVSGDPVRGRDLMDHFECSRCHQGAGLAPAAPEKQCVPCHRDILSGKTVAPTPELEGTAQRFRRNWVAGFLVKPHDLRPLLSSTMPRLAITEADARDMATYLVPREDPAKERAEADTLFADADLDQGRALLGAKGCASCHWMGGVTPFVGQPVAVYVAEPSRAMSLAPDFRYTRERMSAAAVVRWIKNPEDVKADTLMPRTPLSDAEITNIAAYILRTPLTPAPKREIPKSVAVLERPVLYAEVRDKVLQRTCWHCHSDPDLERGDVGPGNVGGFGFEPRHLDLATYEGIFAGTVDRDGQRHSLFAPMPDGTPRIVAALMARQREENGEIDPAIRGMPLGLPALPLEDIQLVATWIAQGRRR
jgi:cytochrome c1